MSKNVTYVLYNPRKAYGFFHLVFDVLMTIFTCGLWLLVIIIRYLRTNSR